MAQKDILQRSVDAGRDVGQRTQDRVEAVLQEIVRLSEQQTEQARALLNAVVERSRSTSEQVVDVVDRELRQQVANLGLATQADIARLEAEIAALRGKGAGKTSSPRAAKKATAKKAATNKAAAKKAAATKAATKKAGTKKAVATPAAAPATGS